MALKLAFNEFPQQVDDDGAPISGGQLFTYVAGSSTKSTTYQDSAGNTANTNPIVFDASGRPPYPIWLTTGITYKFVFAPADDTDPPQSPIWTLDNITGINDTQTDIDQWVIGPAPTYVSATSFTLVGDQTSAFHVGRRLKTTNSGGTVYSTIVSTAFTTSTTVTVANDSGTLDAGLSAVSYGLISAVNPSIDADMIHRKGSSVASAATCNIWGIAGDYVHITGSTGPITSFGTAPYAGARRLVVFDSTPTVTYNATTLVTPGQTSFTAQAGSIAEIVADTTANLRVQWVWQAFSIAAKLPRNALAGLAISNNGSDATNDIDFAVGECRDSTNACDMIALTAMTKQLDAAWAAGTDAGGRMSAAAITNTTYHCFIIRKDSDGTCDFGFDTSATSPTMPSGYTYFRRVGSVIRASNAILAFTKIGDDFYLTTAVQNSTTNPGTTDTPFTLTVPIGIRVVPYFHICSATTVTAQALSLRIPDVGPTEAPSTTDANANWAGAANGTNIFRMNVSQHFLYTNTSGQINLDQASSAAGAFEIRSYGWRDRRGRDD